MNKKILIVHGPQDAAVFNDLALYYAPLSHKFGAAIIPHLIHVDQERLKNKKLTSKEAKRFTKAVEGSSVIIFLVSSYVISSLEIDAYFEKHPDIIKEKYIISVITRFCMWESSPWVKNTYLETFDDHKPLLSNPKEKQEEIFQNLGKEIINYFDPSLASAAPENFRVFISYSTKDGYFADLLKYKLQESNIPVSIDVDYLLPGKNWKIAIDEEIDRCDVVLVVYSKNSKESEYVLYEWAYAMGRNKIVFPLVIEEEIELHPKLAELEVFKGLIDRKNPNWIKLQEIVNTYKSFLQSSKPT